MTAFDGTYGVLLVQEVEGYWSSELNYCIPELDYCIPSWTLQACVHGHWIVTVKLCKINAMPIPLQFGTEELLWSKSSAGSSSMFWKLSKLHAYIEAKPWKGKSSELSLRLCTRTAQHCQCQQTPKSIGRKVLGFYNKFLEKYCGLQNTYLGFQRLLGVWIQQIL